jgi:hypothetical protein
MTLDEVKLLIKTSAARMDALYGKPVFDEWAIISLAENRARVLAYIGPRNDDFLKNFANDLGSLRTELLNDEYGIGDFAFARQADGTHFEAFMILGVAIYLIFNNTQDSMDNIAKDPRWLKAQVPFAEIGDTLRINPLVVVTDTQFFKK